MFRTLVSIVGFLLAAVTAPPVSVTAFLVLAPLLPSDSHLRAAIADDLPMVYFFALLMGVVPSVVFGALVLAVMRKALKPWRPKAWVLATGGAAAAVLYGLISTLVGFAPWGRAPLEEPAGTAAMAACILLSGVVAGLIYAPFAKRG